MPELPDLAHVEDQAARRAGGQEHRGRAHGRSDGPAHHGAGAASRALLAGRRLETSSGAGTSCASASRAASCIVVNAMLVGRYKLVPRAAPPRRRRRIRASLGLALVFARRARAAVRRRQAHGQGLRRARRRTRSRSRSTARSALDLMSPAFTREAFGASIAQAARSDAHVPDGQAARWRRSATPTPTRSCSPRGIHPKTFCNKLDPGRGRRALRGDPVGAAPRDRRDRAARPSRSTSRCATSCGARARRQALPASAAPRSAPCASATATPASAPQCQPTARKLFVDWSKLPGPSRPGLRRMRDQRGVKE